MQTIKRRTIEIEIQPAPMTPLNLRLGVAYAPREAHPVFAAYSCVEVAPDVFEVGAFQHDGVTSSVHRGELWPAYTKLALCLGM